MGKTTTGSGRGLTRHKPKETKRPAKTKQVGRPRLSSRERTRKVTVSLTPDRIDAIHSAVAAGRAASVSAYVSDAIDEHAERDTLSMLLDEMDAELGPPSADAETWAEGVLSRLDHRLASDRGDEP